MFRSICTQCGGTVVEVPYSRFSRCEECGYEQPTPTRKRDDGNPRPADEDHIIRAHIMMRNTEYERIKNLPPDHPERIRAEAIVDMILAQVM